MKNSITNAFVLVTLIFFLGCSENNSDANLNIPSAEFSQGNMDLVVAFFDPQLNEFVLNAGHLVKHFPDGGPIEKFAVRKYEDGYGFIRMGLDAQGNPKSEAFQTVASSSDIKLPVFEGLVWFVVCDNAACSFCMPNSQGTNCECDVMVGGDTGTSVYDSMGNYMGELESGDPSGGATTICNFGTSGGGLFPTQVFQ